MRSADGFRARARRWIRVGHSLCLLAAPFVVLAAVSSCTAKPPRNPDDICHIFDDRGGWKRAAKKAERRWGLPPHIAMAFVHRESHYVADAKPPRKRLLGVIPWRRPSSAYGYAQATDEAWHDYRKDAQRIFVDRDNFGDSLDFIGWYNHQSARRLKIPKTDAYNLYLAYYTGHTGYARGVWKRSPKIQGYATKVRVRAERYARQLESCS